MLLWFWHTSMYANDSNLLYLFRIAIFDTAICYIAIFCIYFVDQWKKLLFISNCFKIACLVLAVAHASNHRLLSQRGSPGRQPHSSPQPFHHNRGCRRGSCSGERFEAPRWPHTGLQPRVPHSLLPIVVLFKCIFPYRIVFRTFT